MKREIYKWYSPSLNKEMDIVVYGHYGMPLLMFPTAGADFLEYERFQLIDSIKPVIDEGKFKVFSINSINNESWLNNGVYPTHKSLRHGQYNQYIIEEAVPFIFDNCSCLLFNLVNDNTTLICGLNFSKTFLEIF